MGALRRFGVLAGGGLLGSIGYRTLIYDPPLTGGGCVSVESRKFALKKAIADSRLILLELQKKASIPGLSVAVSINGHLIWGEGFGYSDVEGKVPCTPKTVMKIASISKSITSAILAKEVENGRLNLDANVSQYVTDWPQQFWREEKVEITPRLLACHMGGIRGYKPMNDENIPPPFRYEEYHLDKKYESVTESLQLFKKDPLIAKPGEKFEYSNHGYTLLSGVLEIISKRTFSDLLKEEFKKFDMRNTFIDEPEQIIYNRSRQYSIKDGIITNAPYVESSFKIAAAGLLSSVLDLITFANIMLVSYSPDDSPSEPKPPMEGPPQLQEVTPFDRFLKKDTVKMLWTPVEGTSVGWHKEGKYGLGWQIVESKGRKRVYVGHTGKSVGTSSVLFISLPSFQSKDLQSLGRFKNIWKLLSPTKIQPKRHRLDGIVVAILSNLEGISLGPVAIEIADLFDDSIRVDA